MFHRFLFFLLGISSISFSSFGQDEPPAPRRGSKIIDDTTKQVYGPKTSKYFYEEDIFFNRYQKHFIDTAIRDFHRFTYIQRFQNKHQDLGNIGTAIRSIFVEMPAQIGRTAGFNSYNLYWDANPVKYFDTKSPYSNLNVILGGKGRSLTNVVYSRNINPRWNIGFDYRAILVDKQIQRANKGDRHVKSNYYDIFTSYHSKDSSYRLFANFRRMYHRVDEYGGIRVGADYNFDDFFLVNALPWLTEAESNDLRRTYHLFHQYSLGSGLQFYHTSDYDGQQNRFIDNPASVPAYYDFVEVDSAETFDQTKFKTFRNEAGIKGSLLKLFYNGYIAVRQFDIDYKYFDEDNLFLKTKGGELFIGGRMELALDSVFTLQGNAEYLFDEKYKIEAKLLSRWLDASLHRSVSMPSFLQRAYKGSHDIWYRPFNNIEVNQLKGAVKYNGKKIFLSAGVNLTSLHNYVYFNQDTTALQDVLPVQSSGNQTVVMPEVKFSLSFLKHFYLRGDVTYSKLLDNAGDAIQQPEWFANAQLCYENILINGNLDMQMGVDTHWKSSYYANGYDPVIQQFYTQQYFKNPSMPIVDVFFNMKMKRGRIFLKYNNLFYAFTKEGYLPTPYYPGQKPVFDFGFDWSFYD
ncbi:MAG: putative porin [Flammeovirgaceae bacterium]|nr:putative porin [Flammeovirgaceae bacterium]